MHLRAVCLALTAAGSLAAAVARAQFTRAARIVWVSISRADEVIE